MTNEDYFSLRNVDSKMYDNFEMPEFLKKVLLDKNAKILDFGCGFGQVIFSLQRNGYKNIAGADINEVAIKHLKENGISVYNLESDTSFYNEHDGYFDFVIMSHVLEHIQKNEVIKQLKLIRGLIKPGGGLIVMVPNAQSNTGCYWAYEDFTHHLLFTSGSLYYVLKAAGYSSVIFLDVDCLASSSGLKKFLRKFFLWIYKLNYKFWNRITASSFHRPSQQIFSYEIKVLALK